MGIEVYKLPTTVDPEAVRALTGDEGTFLNPILDADGNWVISVEEWNSDEFQKYKDIYSTIIGDFELIPFNPVIVADTPPEQ